MAAEDRESFVRWQGITRDYFSSVSNLVLGLSTGLLAFLVSGLASPQPNLESFSVLGALSAALLALSVAVAVWCAINRLRDFRATARIARLRWRGGSADPSERIDSTVVGRLSCRLFWWQLVLFGLGSAGTSLALVMRLWA